MLLNLCPELTARLNFDFLKPEEKRKALTLYFIKYYFECRELLQFKEIGIFYNL